MKRFPLFFLLAVLFFFCPGVEAAQKRFDGNTGISVSTALSIEEVSAVRFGNFAVGSPGGDDASIVLDIDGGRVRVNGNTTTITLLNGGVSDVGSQGPGFYQIAGGGSGVNIYITFTDHAGDAITASNFVPLVGPIGSGNFRVSDFTFNSDGTDGGGDYITTDGSGNATVRVGATLRTTAGVSTYAAGTYRGTFQIMASY